MAVKINLNILVFRRGVYWEEFPFGNIDIDLDRVHRPILHLASIFFDEILLRDKENFVNMKILNLTTKI